MPRRDRLFELMQLMRDGALHRADDLATALGVSVRTIYRDMDTLAGSGVAVAGTPGAGYRVTAPISLPPLNLSQGEFEALSLGVAIVAEAADPDLRAAGSALADKLDAALPDRTAPLSEAWRTAPSPYANTTRAFALMPTLRAAIRARQKLRIAITSPQGQDSTRIVRPLRLDFWARIWTLTAWCEATGDTRNFRVDLIRSAEALPEMFTYPEAPPAP